MLYPFQTSFEWSNTTLNVPKGGICWDFSLFCLRAMGEFQKTHTLVASTYNLFLENSSLFRLSNVMPDIPIIQWSTSLPEYYPCFLKKYKWTFFQNRSVFRFVFWIIDLNEERNRSDLMNNFNSISRKLRAIYVYGSFKK